MMDNYDELILLYKEATGHLNEEDDEALEFTLQKMMDHQDCEENVWKSLSSAQFALESEDPVLVETKLILGQG
jgi:hypothetical protein